MNIVKIKDRPIGDGCPAYIIAEIGINHNGDVKIAKEMIDAAWECGADAVKIQTFITKDFLHPKHPSYKYDIQSEISHKIEKEIWAFAKRKQITLFSTPEEIKSVFFIKKQKPPAIKIAAMDFNYKELIQEAACLMKPIILSSGMSTMEEVKQAVKWVEKTGNREYIVLHCVSCYPTKPISCNLSVMQNMKRELNCPVGFSDHTQGIHIPLAAVAMGANVIEKHFTIDKKLPGPDQKCSADPFELKELIRQIRDIELAKGNGEKKPSKEENEPRIFKRRGVYTKRNMNKGDKLNRNSVVFYAPSTVKSSVSNWEKINNKILKRNIGEMKPIGLDDLVL